RTRSRLRWRSFDAAIHVDRHPARRAVLFLHRDARAARAQAVQRAAARDHRSSGLRARLSGPSEHARVDADLSAVALALRALLERRRRRRARARLDRRARAVFLGLFARRPETAARLLRSKHG